MPYLASADCNNQDMIEAGWDYNPGEVDTGLVKLESNSVRRTSDNNKHLPDVALHAKSNSHGRIAESEGNKSPSASSTGQSGTCILDHDKSHVDDTSPCSTSPMSAAPICRQFWKAGAYNDDLTPVSKTHAGSSYLHIHPKFLHSNATSHKWAFGAIAEILDNAVDEIQKGATYVLIDKITNPRNGSPALLIQDDGAGMDPEAMRRCMSFGFSDKKSDSAIGKYGNGFKTSSMRLGADAIVFSRNFVRDSEDVLNGTLTQSIGLLSYTFLTQSGYDRIVVPMVHYELDFKTGFFRSLQPKSDQNSNSNLSVLLKWSPYSTEEELLKQFDDFSLHGTKVVIYNLWLDNEGNVELDFESDPEDIRIEWYGKSEAKDDSIKTINDNHIANRYKYSLRAYLSILYVKLPECFCIKLRKKVVLYNNIRTDLKHPEFIVYKPHKGGGVEGEVLTTIGFLKEAPKVGVHGFNIYHKDRLILPFLPVVAYGKSRGTGRGVVGVLEANFIEPTHNKQDFEKTNVFQKLVTRLKEMTYEYWDCHCGLIGYQVPKKARSSLPSKSSCDFTQTPPPSRKKAAIDGSKSAPVITTVNSRAALHGKSPIIESVELVPCFPLGDEEGSSLKRKLPDQQPEGSRLKNHMRETSVDNNESNMADDIAHNQKMITLMKEQKNLQEKCLESEMAEEELNLKADDIAHNQKMITLMKEQKNLQEKCLESEMAEEELNLKVMKLKIELEEAQKEYDALFGELQVLENLEVENKRHLYMNVM